VSSAWQLGQHGEVGDHLGQIYEKRGEKNKAIETYALAMTGLRPVPETKDRLARLSGGSSTPAPPTRLQNLRSTSVARSSGVNGQAQFFVMLTAVNSGASVDGVKFISGDEKMRAMTEALGHLKVGMSFPDDTPTKVFRRGILTCPENARDCDLVWVLPDDVRSVD